MLPYDPIGLDLSLTSTGIAIGDDTRVIDAKGLSGPERLIRLRNRITDAIVQRRDEVGLTPLVLVEGYSFASRNSHAHALGELGGIVRVELWEADIPYVEVAPTVRAKFATGRGNAGKSEVVSAVSARTGIIWDGAGNEDRCDAWVLQEIGLAQLGRARHEWPTGHLAALDKIVWPLALQQAFTS
jgi:crossover junction endodeoxyribonuclease RuvC